MQLIYFNAKSVHWILLPWLAYSATEDRISISVGGDPTDWALV